METTPARPPRIRIARPQDAGAAAALMPLALQGADFDAAAFADGLRMHGGRIPVPYGHGLCLTVQQDYSAPVTGVCYTTPLVEWLQQHPARHRMMLARTVAGVEALAVDPGHRQRGQGSALLKATEDNLRSQGVRILVAKVDRSATAVLRWYRRRSYAVAGEGETVAFHTTAGVLGMDAGDARHFLVAKPLIPATRFYRRGGSTLLLEQLTG